MAFHRIGPMSGSAQAYHTGCTALDLGWGDLIHTCVGAGCHSPSFGIAHLLLITVTGPDVTERTLFCNQEAAEFYNVGPCMKHLGVSLARVPGERPTPASLLFCQIYPVLNVSRQGESTKSGLSENGKNTCLVCFLAHQQPGLHVYLSSAPGRAF